MGFKLLIVGVGDLVENRGSLTCSKAVVTAMALDGLIELNRHGYMRPIESDSGNWDKCSVNSSLGCAWDALVVEAFLDNLSMKALLKQV